MQSVGRSRYTVTQILLLVTPGGWGGGGWGAATARLLSAAGPELGMKMQDTNVS